MQSSMQVLCTHTPGVRGSWLFAFSCLIWLLMGIHLHTCMVRYCLPDGSYSATVQKIQTCLFEDLLAFSNLQGKDRQIEYRLMCRCCVAMCLRVPDRRYTLP